VAAPLHGHAHESPVPAHDHAALLSSAARIAARDADGAAFDFAPTLVQLPILGTSSCGALSLARRPPPRCRSRPSDARPALRSWLI
jgi:hypothetical protein